MAESTQTGGSIEFQARLWNEREQSRMAEEDSTHAELLNIIGCATRPQTLECDVMQIAHGLSGLREEPDSEP